MTHVRTTIDSPVGDLTLVASDAGLRAVLWEQDGATRVPLPADVVDDPGHPVLRAAAEQLDEYFAGTRTEFDVPLAPVKAMSAEEAAERERIKERRKEERRQKQAEQAARREQAARARRGGR